MPNPCAVAARRRDFLRWSALASLAGMLHCRDRRFPNAAQAAASSPRAPETLRACIFVMHYGGPSHLDTWDMKPKAAAEIRGEYQPIATNVPGRFVCEHLPRLSRLVDKVAVIRSMHHKMTNHNAAMYEALVGRGPDGGDNELLPANRARDFPSYGAALTYLVEHQKRARPRLPLNHVALPHVLHNVVDLAGQTAGFLGGRYDPLQVKADPNHPQFRVHALRLPSDIPKQRLATRRSLLNRLTTLHLSDNEIPVYRERAFELLGNAAVRKAFDIHAEKPQVRDRYGRNKFGQSLLLARRLVEAGVPFVNVNDKRVNSQNTNWDSHQTIFPRHRELLPAMDQGLSALLEDLDQRGLLNSTLVVSMGEFGRTPRVNAQAGRDHWPHCYSVLLSGGGVRAGLAYGDSDSIGAYPAERPVTPGDLAATLFHRFGVDPRHEIHDPQGRPFRLATGRPLRELFSG